ncbi:hypothetical protein I552_6971 [Mycobacterium xenopi 3993]|nr:hypothetical protein I552_6971 [Mycobacterium xenopi 3993]
MPPHPRIPPGAVTREIRFPSRKLVDSIRSWSVSTGRSWRAAMGAAVSWARSNGEAITATTSWSASASATACACCLPLSDRWNSASRP